MNDFNITRRGLISLAAAALAPRLAFAELPGDSVYRLDAKLVDQNGKSFELASLQGAPVLATMFYTSCDMVCPMIFETVHATLKALPAADRAKVKILLVSFDPEHDTVAALKKQAVQRQADTAQWVLARADEATARKVAAVLGIQYRKLANGEYNHSSTIDLLDKQGRIVAKTGKLGTADPALVGAIRKA
ncbi:SCO family protein [Ramlibacter albus]|uniref:SCO family protein n=1 Tax=Ramlibacter albus TaxID=2079448 RepID=A0A923MEK6_9BURK|nr:SCO family protein [Ramlibacter albus]MBC5768146.1 SCO family protein [Ramlibacter albus]